MMKNLTAMFVCALAITVGDKAIANDSLCPVDFYDMSLKYHKADRQKAIVTLNHKTVGNIRQVLQLDKNTYLVTREEFKMLQKAKLRQAQGLIVGC